MRDLGVRLAAWAGQRRERDETGAATVEYVGIVVFVGVLLSALTISATPVGDAIVTKLCQAIGAECGLTKQTAEAETDPQPTVPCERSATTTSVATGASVMFGVAGSDESLSLIEMSDGTYTVHKSTDGLLAAEYAVGDWRITATGNDQGIDVNANAAVGVGLTGAVATEWNFSSRADAEAFIDTWGGPAAAAGNGGIPVIGIGIERGRELGRVITGKRPPEPDIIHISGGATIHGSGRASDLYGIGASAAVQFSDVTGVSVDRGENEITVFTEVDLSSEFGGQFAVAGKSDSLQGNASASIGLTFDSSGSVTQVQVQAAATSEASGVVQMLAQASGRPVSAPLADHPGEGVVYTANVPVSARNEAWARGIAAQSAMAAPSAVVPGGYGVYTATRYDIAQEIIAQAARDGDTTAVFGTVDRSGLFDLGIAAKVSGVGFGLGTSGSTESRSGGDAYYLADHGWKRWTLCAR